MWGYILQCDGCLADIKLGANDLECVSDHTYASSPRYETEEEAYWAGVAKAMERDALEIHEFFYGTSTLYAVYVETYER